MLSDARNHDPLSVQIRMDLNFTADFKSKIWTCHCVFSLQVRRPSASIFRGAEVHADLDMNPFTLGEAADYGVSPLCALRDILPQKRRYGGSARAKRLSL